MHRLKADGTIVGVFKNSIGPVVSVQGIQDRLSQFDPRGHRLASIRVPGCTSQQVQFWFSVLCPNGLQHCSMPPFGCCLQIIVLKISRFQEDESVEIGDVQLVAMRHQMGHLVQDTLAERKDGYNIRVLLLPKLYKKNP
ncbi:hypothetical protein NPIL_9381 [Nephila pilipes]|uniref:Uncharacterized protein n=1 Tax=Nephila pilipes TaxID=299642 RepID=A0A8X6T5C4_NEPPI|nr:hypothetical protein NPIL_9381 [Nephila pilipes]